MVMRKAGLVCVIIFAMEAEGVREEVDSEARARQELLVNASAAGSQTAVASPADANKEQFVDMSDVTLVVTGTIEHSDFVKLVKASSEPVGMTGDQSFIETLFLEKVPWYETMAWKHELYGSFMESVKAARDSNYMDSNSAEPFLDFLNMCPKELSFESGTLEWNSDRFIPDDLLPSIARQVDLFTTKTDELQKAVHGVKEWIAKEKDFAHWMKQKITEQVDWNKVSSRPGKQLKVFLFMENIAGFGNTILLKRTEELLKKIKFDSGSHTDITEELDTVVTTIAMHAGTEATPGAISERHPEWKVFSGSWKDQYKNVVNEAYEFQPDIAIAAPATSYSWGLRPLLAKALGTSNWKDALDDKVHKMISPFLKALLNKFPALKNKTLPLPNGLNALALQMQYQEPDPNNPDLKKLLFGTALNYLQWLWPLIKRKPQKIWPTIWLGEYDVGFSANASMLEAQIWPMGIGKSSTGVLIPELEDKLQKPFVSDVAKVLAEKAESELVLFSYLHAEHPVRDFLLLARELSKQKKRRVIVVMPRMRCTPQATGSKEHDFRNMQAMLQNLTKSDGAFGDTLKVIRAEKGKSTWYDGESKSCREVDKNTLSNLLPSHVGVEGGEALLEQLA